MCACVRTCVRVCVRVCARVRMLLRMRVLVRVHTRVRVAPQPHAQAVAPTHACVPSYNIAKNGGLRAPSRGGYQRRSPTLGPLPQALMK